MKNKKIIPLLDLKSEYLFLKKDIQKAFFECLKTQQWILGEQVLELEKYVCRYIKTRHAIGVASGTDALLLSLRALALLRAKNGYFEKKNEIITTPFTFVATAEAIIRSGATPVFVDIDPDTFCISPQAIEKAVTKNTVGILPVHLYGLASDMFAIKRIAAKYNLFVVEDCAQAFGGAYGKKRLGSFGDCGAFSFFPSKNLGAYGDGGCITTNNNKLAQSIRMLRSHGQKEYADALYIGYNSRLDTLQAAILLAKLKHIDTFIALRRDIARQYKKALCGCKKVQLPYESENTFHSYGLYTIKVNSDRDGLQQFLNKRGIAARIYYHKPLYAMKAFERSEHRGTFVGLKSILGKVISLPMHPFLKPEQIQYIARCINEFYTHGK